MERRRLNSDGNSESYSVTVDRIARRSNREEKQGKSPGAYEQRRRASRNFQKRVRAAAAGVGEIGKAWNGYNDKPMGKAGR